MGEKHNLIKHSSKLGQSTDPNSTSKTSKTKKVKNKRFKKIIIFELVVCCIVVSSYLFLSFSKKNSESDNSYNLDTGTEQMTDDTSENSHQSQDNIVPVVTLTPEEIEQQRLEEEEKVIQQKIAVLIEKADQLALGYDYNGAIEMIQSFEGDYSKYEALNTKIAGYEASKKKLDPFGAYDSVNQISHIFFHSLVADTAKAFDDDKKSNGYNYYMTTVTEFKEMMQQMYNDGYVLVSIHDLIKKVTAEDGTIKFVEDKILLPPDKKPFVLSQDDVNYYAYMDGDGFASRIVIDENGRPSTEMIMEDGTTSIGDYDVVPVLETFIAEHPDFSYKGARGIMALTGYEGTLGYRTNDTTSPTYEQDKETVKQVVKVLKDWGWEFASHSFGHRNMQTYGYNFLVHDTDRWMEEVGSLIGPTDIYVYPYGIDIETSMGTYSSKKYKYLKKLGFNYFCGVFKDPWIQIKDDYIRMTRRPLDGQAMLQFPERLTDLFDLSAIIDESRPALK